MLSYLALTSETSHHPALTAPPVCGLGEDSEKGAVPAAPSGGREEGDWSLQTSACSEGALQPLRPTSRMQKAVLASEGLWGWCLKVIQKAAPQSNGVRKDQAGSSDGREWDVGEGKEPRPSRRECRKGEPSEWKCGRDPNGEGRVRTLHPDSPEPPGAADHGASQYGKCVRPDTS